MRTGSLGLLLGSIACGGDRPTGPRLPECDRLLTVSATAGTTPTFDWVPGCRAEILEVYDVAANQSRPIWRVSTSFFNRLPPPVTYGIVPTGANTYVESYLDTLPPPTLAPGRTYRVMVWAHWENGEFFGASRVLGQKDFVP